MVEDGMILDCGHKKVGSVGYVKTHDGVMICSPCQRKRKINAYRPEVLRRERRNLSDCIGFMTLVGHMREPNERPPYESGNCCDILNMYAENAEAIISSMPDVAVDCEVEIVQVHSRERVRVVDERIPDGYKRHVCSVCSVYEDPEILASPQEDMSAPISGFEIVEFGGPPRKLNATWSQEGPNDGA